MLIQSLLRLFTSRGRSDESYRLSAAQRMLEGSKSADGPEFRENEYISIAHVVLVERFRHAIDKELIKPGEKPFDFSAVIKSTVNRVSLESTAQGKFELLQNDPII